MPFTRRPKTADPGTMLLCPSCAVSTPKDDKRGPWQTCSADCRSTRRALAAALNALAAHGLPDTAEFRSWLAVRPKLWLASQHPKVVRVPAEEGGTLRLAPAPRPGPLEPHHGGYERPWMHLDVDDIRQQWEAHQQAEADAAAPKRNDRGESCYGCGATHAGAWFTVPPPTRPTSVSRRNVSDVVVCDACETDLHAADGDRDRFADRLAVRALFPHLLPSRRRYVTDLAEMFEWRLFGELHAPGTEGTTVPFGYLGGDLLDQARSRAWTIRPRYAPPSFRARQDRAAAAVARVMPSAPAPSGPPAAVRLPDLTIDADEHQEVALP